MNNEGFWYSDDDSLFGEPQFSLSVEAAYNQDDTYSDDSSPTYMSLEDYRKSWVWVSEEDAHKYAHEARFCYDEAILRIVTTDK